MSSRPSITVRSLLAAWVTTCMACVWLYGQDTLQPAPAAPAPYLAALDQWAVSSEDDSLKVPFFLKPGPVRTCDIRLPLPDSLPDTLYIVFEGIGWKTELMLNERYLGVWEDPFRPFVAALPRWLLRESDRLRVRLSTGKPLPGYPAQFMGIHRPAWLMNKAQLTAWQAPVMPPGNPSGVVAVVAPWYRKKGLGFDLREAGLILYPLSEKGIKDLYFAFHPDRQMEALCAKLGFRKVPQLTPQSRVVWVNEYPYEPLGMKGSLPFSFDKTGHRTPSFGNTYPGGVVFTPLAKSDISLLLVLCILFPLAALILLKALSPGFAGSFQTQLFSPRTLIDNLSEVALGGVAMPVVLVLVRWLSMGAMIGLTAFYVSERNLWEGFMPLGRQGLLFRLLYPGGSLGLLLAKGLLVAGVVLGARVLLLGIFAIGAGTRKFREAGMNLDALAAFPLNLVLSLPVAFLLFSTDESQRSIIWLAAGLMILFITRQIYVTYAGLNRIFNLSAGLKILYICALIVLPYLIWW